LEVQERAEQLVTSSGHPLENIAKKALEIRKRHGHALHRPSRTSTEVQEHTAFAYLLGRFPAELAAVSDVFEEVKTRDPTFQPESFFHANSRLNGASLAATNHWPGIEELFCVDLDKMMLDVGEKLFPFSTSIAE
jgi:ribosomal protein RSM22 (predicted rRNA methylase)